MIIKNCARPDCGQAFRAWKRKQKYCAPECANVDRTRLAEEATKKNVEEFAANSPPPQKKVAEELKELFAKRDKELLEMSNKAQEHRDKLLFSEGTGRLGYVAAVPPIASGGYISGLTPPGYVDHGHDKIGKRIVVIPDTQVKPGHTTDHLEWIGKYIADKRPDYVVMIGDWWDMQSLSSYDRGKRSFEGRRYIDDIEAGNAAMTRMTSQYRNVPGYKPAEHFFIGNHEDRITRASDLQPELFGLIGFHQLNLAGWNVHSYLQIVNIEGIKFSHYFTSGPMNRPVPSAAVMLRIAQGSAIQGHVQKVDVAVHEKTGKMALMCGVAYLHTEEYLGAQGNDCRRQIVVLNEVRDGIFDPMFCSLRYLSLRYGSPSQTPVG